MACVLAPVWEIVGCCPNRIKPKTIISVCVASQLSMHHKGERAKTVWLGIRILSPSVVTCLSTACCFSELALEKSN